MSPAAPLLLLQRLRRISAERGDWQKRLERIVELIATGMNVAVCSVYLARREGEQMVLELCANEGLTSAAVHKSRVRLGEGLIGDIALHARPLNLADARTHPRFVAQDEAGEAAFPSFAGVPILRGGKVAGVLSVQDQPRAPLHDDALAALQTVATVLAEMLAGVRLTRQHRLAERQSAESFEGVGLVSGLALGRVVLHAPHVEIGHMLADNTDDELRRLDDSIYALRQSVDALLRSAGHGVGWGEHLDVLETYQMFANDEGWLTRLREAVRTGLTADAAVERVLNDMRARLMGQSDDYLQERLHDLEDLSRRLLRHLQKETETKQLPKDAVLLARMLGPSDLLDYRDKNLNAVVLENGSLHAHVTIVARALGLPVVGRVRRLLDQARAGQAIIVDGDLGQVHLQPPQRTLRAYTARVREHRREQQRFGRLRKLPAQTKDGTRMQLNINGGLLMDVDNIAESGADGVGLFRTELQFLIAARMPRLTEQTQFYASVLDAAAGHRLVFRTLDIGGDKVAPYMRRRNEANPAMGWRALRMALDRPGFLRYQARALLAAAAGRALHLMFPMVGTLDEYRAARALVEREYEHRKRLGHKLPTEIKIGSMLEVPSLIWQLDALLPDLDFLAIGSNDLMQFVFAADRNNPLVNERYDIMSPAGLAVLSYVVDACARHNTPVSLCGEAAGRPLDALVMMGLGIRELSMPRAMIGPVKRMVRSVHLGRWTASLEALTKAPPSGGEALRRRLGELARSQNVQL